MGHIICSFCGARYEDTEKTCPYCGSENVSVSLKEQEEFLENFRELRRRLNDELPRQMLRSATGRIARTAVVIILVFTILIAAAAVISVLRVKQKRSFQQEALETLEKYYDSNMYEEMTEYYYDHDELYSSTYHKYFYLTEIYHWYTTGKEWLESDLDFYSKQSGDPGLWTDSISNDINYLFRAMSMLKELEDNGYVYNEKEGAEYLRGLTMQVLTDTCGFSQEQIDAGTEAYEDFETDYSDLAAIVLGRTG